MGWHNLSPHGNTCHLKSQPQPARKSCVDKDLRSDAACLSAPVAARPPKDQADPTDRPMPHDLARLIDVWPDLPEHTRVAILALISAAGT